VASGFAPPGSHLWSVTVLPGHPLASDAQAVAGEVASWFGEEASSLRHLSYVQVPYAVPVQLPGAERECRELPPGATVAGDSVCGASIDAVMASGEAAAKKVISRRPLN
jgi:predicted NAD/FAD-dependent oxidoreductase